jgi:hypothetical protein
METPSRPRLPGTWLQTPAAKTPAPAPSFSTSVARTGDIPFARGGSQLTTLGLTPADQHSAVTQQPGTDSSRPLKNVNLDERAARAINEALEGEARFPELDGYLSRRSSSVSFAHQMLIDIYRWQLL